MVIDVSDPVKKGHSVEQERRKSDNNEATIDEPEKVSGSKSARPVRRIGKFIAIGIFCLFAIGFVVLKVGIGGHFLTEKMQVAINEQLGEKYHIDIKKVRLSLDDDFEIALEVNDFDLGNLKPELAFQKNGTVKFGFSLIGLLQGKIHVQTIEVHDTMLDISHNKDGSFPGEVPLDSEGRVDIIALKETIFSHYDNLFKILFEQSIKTVNMRNVQIVFLSKDDRKPLRVDRLRIKNMNRQLMLTADFVWNNQASKINGNFFYQEPTRISGFKIDLSSLALHLGAADEATALSPEGYINNTFFRLKSRVNATVVAERATAKSNGYMRTSLNVTDGLLDVATASNTPVAANIILEEDAVGHKIEVTAPNLTIGKLNFPFSGAIGLSNDAAPGEQKLTDYRFEIVSNEAVSAPEESSEQPLPFAMRLAGTLQLKSQKVEFNDISLQSNEGQLFGRGSIRFGKGSPETIFVLHVPKMAVSAAKQLWPVNVAIGGREWVLSHIYGGSISDGELEIALPMGYYGEDYVRKTLTKNEVRISTKINHVRSDIVGQLPAIRDADGTVTVEGNTTTVFLQHGRAYLPDNKQVDIANSTLVIPWKPQHQTNIDLHTNLKTDAQSAAYLLDMMSINFKKYLPFEVADVTGMLDAELTLRFPMAHDNKNHTISYKSVVNFKNFSLAKPVYDILLKDAVGSAKIAHDGIRLMATGMVNSVPADIELSLPFDHSSLEENKNIIFHLDDESRAQPLPFLRKYVSGSVAIRVKKKQGNKRHVEADLSDASLTIPWIGWTKGKGIAAKVEFDIPEDAAHLAQFSIENFVLSGSNFNVSGSVNINNMQLESATFTDVCFNKGDKVALNVKRQNETYNISVNGSSYDARALIKNLNKVSFPYGDDTKFNFDGKFAILKGFNQENLRNVTISLRDEKKQFSQLKIRAYTQNNHLVEIQHKNQASNQDLNIVSSDAGSLLRFLNHYDKIYEGELKAHLSGKANQVLKGPVELKNFIVLNEPKLKQIAKAKSYNVKLSREATEALNTTQAEFERAFAYVEKGSNYLVVDLGTVTGNTIGATFQGIAYDALGNMSLTGTFMPAYKLNSIFSEIPVIGAILGNGREKGLIGITFKVMGRVNKPTVIVNPVSVVAPGIFRSIFEFE